MPCAEAAASARAARCRRRDCSTPRRSGPRCTRRPTWPACGTRPAAPPSTRPGWPGACAGPAWRRACGSTSTPRSPASPTTAARRAASGCCWPPRRARSLAEQVALGTGAFAPLLRRLRYYLVPVYDYVLMTEPLSAAQLASVGWPHRQGVADSANQFHYYRLTRDNRILWGGYDAVYYYGSRISAGAGPAAGHVRGAGPALLRDVPAAGRADVQPRVGRGDRHLHAVLRVLRHRPRRAGWPTRRATPGSASARPGSAPGCCWTCWAASRRS